MGGADGDCDEAPASAEVWDPQTGAFGLAGSLPEPRCGHTATLMPDGRVIIIGGAGVLAWDPASGLFDEVGSLRRSR